MSNTGARAGKQTVLAFWRPVGHHSHLRQKLLAYRGTALAPGASAVVSFAVEPAALALTDAVTGDKVVRAGKYEVVFRDGTNELVHEIELRGPDRTVEAFPTA